MLEEKKEESKTEEEEQSSHQDNSTDETTDSSQTEEETSQKNDEGDEAKDEWTPPSKEEFEKVLKKAKDFDGLIEKKRFEKLAKKTKIVEEKKEEEEEDDYQEAEEQKVYSADEVKELVREEVAKHVISKNRDAYNENLKTAYREFIKVNPWADSDDVISNIAKKFNPGEAIDTASLLSKIERAADESYPSEFRESQESKIRAKILMEQEKINVGDGGMSSSSRSEKPDVKMTDEDRRIADKYFGGDIEKYLKYKKDN